MRYDFLAPRGWTADKLPNGGRGLVLQAPPSADPRERAALFLLDPLVPVGTEAEQLRQAMATSLCGIEVVKAGAVQPLVGAAYPGLLAPVRVRVPASQAGSAAIGGSGPVDEGRVYILLSTPSERLLIVFVGGQKALPQQQGTLDAFLRSIRPTAADGMSGGPQGDSPYGAWGE